MCAEIAAAKQRGRPFQRGQSGNPNGKPKGVRNRATLAAEALLDGEAEALTRKAIEMAMAGDVTALKLCLERLVPPRKERPLSFALPPFASAEDTAKAIDGVLAAWRRASSRWARRARRSSLSSGAGGSSGRRRPRR
jgi:Family of unknown function (DUF5681)